VLGHRRLAVIDLTEAAAQPMVSEDNRFALVYNGELYNFNELKRTGGQRRTVQVNRNTEVLLRLLMKFGEDAIPRLNGMFAFASGMKRKDYLSHATDLGKSLLHDAAGNLWMFASEIRACWLQVSFLASWILRVSSFLSYGSVQGPSTIVKVFPWFQERARS
jgi:asparagine synthase (glutamine-hydrolysing)